MDVNIPIHEGAVVARVLCPICPQHPRMEWIPQVGRMDAANGPGFVAFETRNGRNEKVQVTSLKQLREIERQSEVDYKNGEGQPLVFRAFSNTKSSMDQSALHPNWNGGEAPTPAAAHRFGSATQRSADAPETPLGPGVTDDTASALSE